MTRCTKQVRNKNNPTLHATMQKKSTAPFSHASLFLDLPCFGGAAAAPATPGPAIAPVTLGRRRLRVRLAAGTVTGTVTATVTGTVAAAARGQTGP